MALFGGSDTRINATFTATDKVTPVVRSLRSEFTRLGSRTGGPLGGLIGGFGSLGGAAIGLGAGFTVAAGAGELAGKALAGFLSAGLRGQEVQARLTTSLNDNAAGWERYQGAIDNATDSGVKMGFQDDELQDSLAQLVPFTHSVNDALKIQAAAMDIARLKGISLKDASIALGKAYGGNVTTLRRMGIAIDTGVHGMEAITVAERVAGGQAEAFSHTFAGATSRMGAEIDRLEQNIGMKMIPAFTDATVAINNFAFGTDKAVGEVSKATDNIAGAIVTARPKVVGALRTMGTRGRRALHERFLDMAADALTLGGNLADNLRADKGVVGAAMDDLIWAMDHPMKLEKERARIAGALTGAKLAAGLRSQNPEVRAVAEQTLATLEAQWLLITGSAWSYGADAGAAWSAGYTANQIADPYSIYNQGSTGGTRHPGRHFTGGGHSHVPRGGHTPLTPNSGGSGAHIHLYIDGKEVAAAVDRRFGQGWSVAGSGSTRN